MVVVGKGGGGGEGEEGAGERARRSARVPSLTPLLVYSPLTFSRQSFSRPGVATTISHPCRSLKPWSSIDCPPTTVTTRYGPPPPPRVCRAWGWGVHGVGGVRRTLSGAQTRHHPPPLPSTRQFPRLLLDLLRELPRRRQHDRVWAVLGSGFVHGGLPHDVGLGGERRGRGKGVGYGASAAGARPDHHHPPPPTSIGSANAAVLPDPVSAMPITSRCLRPSGMAAIWIGDGFV